MVGGPPRRRAAVAVTEVDISAAYDGVAEAWATGAAKLYDGLAEVIVDEYPLPVEGRRILDLGASTGAVSRALLKRGAKPVAIDSAQDMVVYCNTHGIPAAVGDLLALPLPDASFDGAIAAFSISHVCDPVQALREASRCGGRGRNGCRRRLCSHLPPPLQSGDRGGGRHLRLLATAVVRPSEARPRATRPTPRPRSRHCAVAAGLAEVSVVERILRARARSPGGDRHQPSGDGPPRRFRRRAAIEPAAGLRSGRGRRRRGGSSSRFVRRC